MPAKKSSTKSKKAKKSTAAPTSPFGFSKNDSDRFTAQEDLRTLDNAKAIKGDKKRMSNMRKELDRMEKAIKEI
jgi:hypothetical protein